MPDDPLPTVDGIVSVGHALNYLPDEAAVQRGLVRIAEALRPGGVLAVDLCDMRWGEVRRDQPNLGMAGDDWAIITEFSTPTPRTFVRQMTTFIKNQDGSWRRDHERHSAIGSYGLPDGLVAIIGQRDA